MRFHAFIVIALTILLALHSTVAHPVSIQHHRLDTTLVTVQYLKDELDRIGRVILYGVYFKSRFVIDERSAPLMRTIASYLRTYPDVHLYVVGHTADTGKWEPNMRLSDVRALAIVKYLIEQCQVERTRLIYYGVGPLCPITPGTSPEAVFTNSRYELIRRAKP